MLNSHLILLVRFYIHTAVRTNITAFWDIASCTLVVVDRLFRFRGAYTSLKHQPTSTKLHGAISKKAVTFILLANLSHKIFNFHKLSNIY
jgi:hypothetical protein